MILLAAVGAATMVGAAGGWTAWSEPAGDRYALILRAPDGVLTAPAITPRGVPFDVSLGTDADGRLVAAYSRCRTEPQPHGGANPRAAGGLPQYATGRGCVIHTLDLAGAGERSTGVGGVLPAVAGSALAFVRVSATGGAAVVVQDTATGAERILQRGRVRRGAPEQAEGPTSVDTDGRRVTTAWRQRDRRAGTFDSRVYVQAVGAARPTLVAGATNTSDTPFVTAFAPALDRGRVHYLLSFGQGYCERRWASGRPDAAYGLARSADTARPVSAAVDGSRLVVAQVPRAGGGEIVAFGARPFAATAAPGELCG